MGFYRNKHLDPPPPPPWKKLDPLESVGALENYSFLWTPSVNCKISWGLKKRCPGCFLAVGPGPSWQKFLDLRMLCHIHLGKSVLFRDSVWRRPSDIVRKKFQMSKNLLSSLDSLSKRIFGNARCTVMHSDAIVFLLKKTIADWPNFC